MPESVRARQALSAEEREQLRRLIDERRRDVIAHPVLSKVSRYPAADFRGLGARIRELRQAQGLSLADVEARTRGIATQSTVSRIERGKIADTYFSRICALAASLNLCITVTPEGVEIAWPASC